jgi:hypothetical protein
MGIDQPSLRDGGGEAILIPALKGRAKFIGPLRGQGAGSPKA